MSRVALDASDTTLWPAPPPLNQCALSSDAVTIGDGVVEARVDVAGLGKIHRAAERPPPELPELPESARLRAERPDAQLPELLELPELSEREELPADERPGAAPEVVVPDGSTLAESSGRLSKPSVSRPSSVSVDDGRTKLRVATGKPYPKRQMVCKLGKPCWLKLEELFKAMDIDSSNAVTREEAALFFKGSFGNVSCEAMFNEVDVDGSGAITADEYVKFWIQVRGAGYSDQDILEEVEQLLEGSSWVDWKDGRDTSQSGVRFPKRPLLCKLSAKVWKSSEELFKRLDADGKLTISKEEATAFFKGAFANVSADAMFKEVDINNHGVVTAADWMQFWTQVKASGYKEKDILEEQEQLLQGGAWVDWNDGRCTA